MEVTSWDTLALANNALAPEGTLTFGQVNNVIRDYMAAEARYLRDNNGTRPLGGGLNGAYTITLNQFLTTGEPPLYTEFAATAAVANIGPSTLTLTTDFGETYEYNIRLHDGSEVRYGDIASGGTYRFILTERMFGALPGEVRMLGRLPVGVSGYAVDTTRADSATLALGPDDPAKIIQIGATSSISGQPSFTSTTIIPRPQAAAPTLPPLYWWPEGGFIFFAQMGGRQFQLTPRVSTTIEIEDRTLVTVRFLNNNLRERLSPPTTTTSTVFSGGKYVDRYTIDRSIKSIMKETRNGVVTLFVHPSTQD